MADTHSHGCTKLRAAACVTAEAAMELDAFCVDAKMEASNPSLSVLHSVQDIIQHEYALVDSIPDEDRAALMPIIRFVRNTLQDPSAIRHNLLQGCGMDVLTLNERPAMLCRQGDGMGGSGCNDMQMMPPWYASNGTDGTRHRDADHMVDMYKEWVPWQTTEACRQHRSFQGPQMQKETQDITSMCPAYGTGHPFSKPVDTLPGDYPVQPRERHDYAGCSEELHDPSSLASHKFGECHESELSSILSGMDMESFHLEELRRSLRPLCNDTGSDANDIGSVDVNNNCADGSGDEDNDDGDNESGRDDMDENDGSLLAYQHYDKASHASDVAWHSYWGNDLQYYPQPSTENLLQFPKLHCRRRNVIKKVVGWVKKRASQSFATRVRHKRRCNLPCCTDCEAGIKRRRVSGNGSKKCAKLSTIIKTSSPLAALHLEKKNNGCRQGSNAEDWKRDFSASNESSDGIEASQVTRDWADSTLTTALIIVLLDSRIRGMTAYEALQGLVQQGYSQMLGSDSRTLAAHVKTTLKECPAFKELRNHRFVLRDWQQLGMPHPAQLPNRESSSLSSSQEECSEDLTKSLGASSRIRKLCHQPDRGKLPRCRKTDGKHWRCMRNAKLGFLYCERHQQSRGRSHGHSSHKKQHPCASDERTNAAEEEMSETVVDSCSGQSIEQDTEEAEPVRCCRTDGRNWQCLNQAEEGLLYCKHHQGRCKKGRVNGQRRIGPDISENTENAPNTGLIKQEKCSPSVSRFAMQLRPRRNAAIVAFLRDV